MYSAGDLADVVVETPEELDSILKSPIQSSKQMILAFHC